MIKLELCCTCHADAQLGSSSTP